MQNSDKGFYSKNFHYAYILCEKFVKSVSSRLCTKFKYSSSSIWRGWRFCCCLWKCALLRAWIVSKYPTYRSRRTNATQSGRVSQIFRFSAIFSGHPKKVGFVLSATANVVLISLKNIIGMVRKATFLAWNSKKRNILAFLGTEIIF